MTLNKKKIGIALLFILPLTVAARQTQTYPPQVQKALQTTSNRSELEKALQYCYQTKDPLKIKSINFLVANLPIHTSQTYYWADEKGKRIAYDEMKYGSFKEAVEAFNELKTQFGKIHPVAYTFRDIDSVTATMLIENVDMAQKSYVNRFGKVLSPEKEKDYLEYVLPYRTSVEPLQNWRKLYTSRFSNLVTGQLPDKLQMAEIGKNIKSWFTNTYKIENRSEPLPRLGAMQLLTRKKGACEDLADLAVFIARSQGVPAAVDFIPAWATASGIHFLTYMPLSGKSNPHFDAADGVMIDSLAREPAKVFRTTYSIQPGTIAYMLHNDTSNIPPNFLRFQNYIDVTNEYWQTADVQAKLFKPNEGTPSFAYLTVWNFSKWRTVWYGKINNDASATFTNMCKGAVYLPVYYIKGKASPAGWPVVNGYSGTMVLQPNLSKKRTLHIKEDPRYLALQSGKKYRLFYWDNAWRSLGDQVPVDKATELVFQNVPSNALLLLVPEYTQHKERPFIINDSGERSWF